MTESPDRLARLGEAVRAYDDARVARDAAIREALAGGERVVDIVASTGLSRSRIYQIRDGVRT